MDMRLLAIPLLLLLSACGGEDKVPEPETPRPQPPVTSLDTGSAMLSWQAPESYTDGTRIQSLGGYKIYYSPNIAEVSGRQSIPALLSPQLDNIALEELSPGQWYFAISAVDSNNVEGELSVILSKNVRPGEGARPLLNCENYYEYGEYSIRCRY